MPNTTSSYQIHARGGGREQDIPLCIDLDGTLVKTDTLLELLLLFLRTRGWEVISLPIWLTGGRASFKIELAKRVTLDPALLPYHAPLVQHIHQERKKGRSVILVTAASENYARTVAEYFGFFDDVLASSRKNNLRGTAKLKCLVDHYGPRGFDYAGNDHTDVIIWKQARRAILVNPGPGVVPKALPHCPDHLILDDRPPLPRTLAVLLGLDRWFDNLLLFLPYLYLVLTDNNIELYPVVLTYCSFTLAATAVRSGASLYFLHQDRQSLAESDNPLASGDLPLLLGFVIPPICLACSGTLFLAVRPVSLFLFLSYLAAETFLLLGPRWRKFRARIIRAALTFLILFSGFQAVQPDLTTARLAILILLTTAITLIRQLDRRLFKRP